MKEIKSNRSSQISVRMTPIERMLIENKAQKSGYSMSQFMVQSALGKEMKILSAEEKQAYLDLAKYHTHFSRISSLFRQGGSVTSELQDVISEIKKTLEIIQNGK